MSITFALPMEHRTVTHEMWRAVYSLPCPECGGHDPYGEVEDRKEADLDCNSCYGMGGNWPERDALEAKEQDSDGEFNVANANGRYIVQDILNLDCEDVYGGSIDPTTVLMRLSYVDEHQGVKTSSESQGVHISAEGVGPGCRVIDMGRSVDQCRSYVARLRRLAEIAIERGAPKIVWG